MKKQLLLGSALLAAISAFPQSGSTLKVQPKMVDLSAKIARKYQFNHVVEPTPFHAPASTGASNQAHARTASVNSSTYTTWNSYTGSENIYGMLVNNSKPVQYNDELGRISFIHRKSHTYITSPLPLSTASTGVIVADVTNDWGVTFDSTALWSNNAAWARYPTGGIFNTSVTNTLASNAYFVGSGPVTGAASSWQGNWFASKRMDTVHGANFNNVPSTAPGAQQFIANTGTGVTGSGIGKVDFARLDFTATDDGKVRTMGTMLNNANDVTTNAAYGLRGGKILNAVFNPGTQTFDWVSGQHDSLLFPARTSTATNAKQLLSEPHMAWSENGAIGYAFMIGVRRGATGSNRGYQPIIMKTTDHGATWDTISEANSINFNSPSMNAVTKRTPGVSLTPTLVIPFFNTGEDMDATVDMNGKLHIMATVQGTSKSHIDSLLYSFEFPNSVDGETYSYGHAPGQNPYIFDFVGDGVSPWSVILVDSMSSEAPGSQTSSDNGFSANPWDIDPTTSSKVEVAARMQMSRTPDGKYIVYTWAESDSATTANSVKWNIAPNVKARMLNTSNMTLHPTKISITDPADINEANPNVRGFAFNHYASPKCALNTNTATPGVCIFLPMTVSNNGATHQQEPINHYFSGAILNFDNVSDPTPPRAPDARIVTGIAQLAINSAKSSVIYPNPAKGNATLIIDMKNNSTVNVSVMNVMGQEVKATSASAQIGQNQINVDLNGLTKGIYMVNVKIDNASSTKKLIVE